MTHHGTVVVDNQVLVLGYTSDTSANQAATAVAVFEITERTPGTLEFRWSDQFVPSALGSGDAEGDANIKSGSSSSAIPAGSALVGSGWLLFLPTWVPTHSETELQSRFRSAAHLLDFESKTRLGAHQYRRFGVSVAPTNASSRWYDWAFRL
ncbi:hypothetical protein BCR44DRAFT_1103474 [Catenaria anguillulae PL171]|uniref:Uncharacterized protein n=1 Tax=Catenaria anguillulae PL171 TaxID=765915 RepID=A0A1Y2I423_9FUNG|nr:hypothetical protein BCR44DRAFT_1103474 [Catenaria anguillulae PL171]